ncbi:hypothetical protein ACS0TY_019264 [Phlomoides rotata]
MGGIHPHAIITDQCESIRRAISDLMPDTIHRFCIWHIVSKIQQKFRGVADFHNCNILSSKEWCKIVLPSRPSRLSGPSSWKNSDYKIMSG